MLSRLSFVTMAAGAAGLAACGRQVTPDPNAIGGRNDLAGKMVIRFRVRGVLDFVNINYVIVFNTSGVGREPYPQAYLTSFTDYSYAFAIGANYGGAGVTLPTLFQYLPVPGSSTLNGRVVPLGASTTQLIPQDSLAGNEFQLTFTREQLDNPLQFQTPSPVPASTGTGSTTASPAATGSPDATSPSAPASASPSAAATFSTFAVASASPSASPTASPTATSFASATPTPNPNPTSQAQRNWKINFFTVDRSGNPIDSLGLGGPTDTSFDFNIDTATQNLFPVYRPSGVIPPSNMSAFIDGGEIDNYP